MEGGYSASAGALQGLETSRGYPSTTNMAWRSSPRVCSPETPSNRGIQGASSGSPSQTYVDDAGGLRAQDRPILMQGGTGNINRTSRYLGRSYYTSEFRTSRQRLPRVPGTMSPVMVVLWSKYILSTMPPMTGKRSNETGWHSCMTRETIAQKR